MHTRHARRDMDLVAEHRQRDPVRHGRHDHGQEQQRQEGIPFP